MHGKDKGERQAIEQGLTESFEVGVASSYLELLVAPNKPDLVEDIAAHH